jgi:hypothetical protein
MLTLCTRETVPQHASFEQAGQLSPGIGGCVIVGLDAYSLDIVEPYVNQTAKDAIKRKLRGRSRQAGGDLMPSTVFAPRGAGRNKAVRSRSYVIQ